MARNPNEGGSAKPRNQRGRRAAGSPAKQPDAFSSLTTTFPLDRPTCLFSLLLAALTVLTFFPCLRNGFIEWDDPELLVGNPLVRDLSPSGIARMFRAFQAGTYIPITILSYAVEFRFWGFNPVVYHLTNVLLHAASSALALLLLRRVGFSLPGALFAAALFAVHPLRVESVAWVTERKDVLSVFFCFVSLHAYLGYLRRPAAGLLATAWGLFALAGLAKGSAVTLPAALLLLDLYLGRRDTKRMLWEKIPFFAMIVILAVAGFAAQDWHLGGGPDAPYFRFRQRLLIGSYVFLFYLRKIVWPADLACLYPYPAFPHGTEEASLPTVFGLSLLPLALIIGIAVVVGRRNRHVAFGSAFFALTVLPLLQIIPLSGSAMAADRYTYFPAFGLFLIAGKALEAATASSFLARGGRRFVLPAMAAGLCLFLAGMSWSRCKVWRDVTTLFTDSLSKYPDSPIAYHVRASAWQRSGDLPRAIADLDAAVAIHPRFKEAYYNRGCAHFLLGRHREAVADFSAALAIHPGYADALYNRARAWKVLDQPAKAMEDIGAYLRLVPRDAEAIALRDSLSARPGREPK